MRGSIARTKKRRTVRELRDEIVRLAPWHLDVEVTPTLSTRAFLDAVDPPKDVSFISPREPFLGLMRRLYPDGLEGRNVLDCACNCGGYLFWAKEVGAGRCFGFDAREHWIKQARFLLDGRRKPTEGIEFAVCDLYDLPERDPGSFDITIFKGIFYHLPDPITGLKIAADRTNELLLLNTSTRNGLPDGALAVEQESREPLMSGVYGLNWLPTGPQVLGTVLRWLGFVEVHCSFWNKEAAGQLGRNGRIELVASRRKGLLEPLVRAGREEAVADERDGGDA